MEVKPLIVSPEGARQLLGGCSRAAVYDLIKSGQIESYSEGKARRITVSSIEAYIQRRVAGNGGKIEKYKHAPLNPHQKAASDASASSWPTKKPAAR
jgi:hypothetical protein